MKASSQGNVNIINAVYEIYLTQIYFKYLLQYVKSFNEWLYKWGNKIFNYIVVQCLSIIMCDKSWCSG